MADKNPSSNTNPIKNLGSFFKRLLFGKKKESSSSFYWLLALILFVRWAVVEPFKIPSGSMKPTLLIGDHLFVSKSGYDIRIPFTKKSLLKVSDPKRGDVIVFRFPGPGPMHGAFYIKRIIGVPGDVIEVRGGVPFLNDKAYEQIPVAKEYIEKIPAFDFWDGNYVLKEKIPGARYEEHLMQRYGRALGDLAEGTAALEAQLGKPCAPFQSDNLSDELKFYKINHICSFTVPDGNYFVMGDNRDDSQDGRFFGFVERPEIMGRAIGIWLSVPLEGWQMQRPFFEATYHFIVSIFKTPFDKERVARIGTAIK